LTTGDWRNRFCNRSKTGCESATGAKQEHFHMGSGLAQDCGNPGDVHVLCVAEPQGLKMQCRQQMARVQPDLGQVLPAGKHYGGIIEIWTFRLRCIRDLLLAAEMVDRLVPGDGEEPGGKGGP
jgi:hypothetical protein